MILYGTLKLGTLNYLCYMKDLKGSLKICVLSDEYLGEDDPKNYKKLHTVRDLNRFVLTPDYLITGFVQNKRSNNVTFEGAEYIVDNILSLFEMQKQYPFKAEDIKTNIKEDYIERYTAYNSECLINYTKNEDKLYRELTLEYQDIKLELVEYPEIKIIDRLPSTIFKNKSKDLNQKMNIANLSVITMSDLYSKLNMSWYNNKKYRAITTVDEFEKYVMDPLNQTYKEAVRTGEPMLLALDTETTGLNIYNLSDSNPYKSHIVATPISWEDDSAVVVFNNMKHFDNVPTDYMMKRLKPFLEKKSELNRDLINLIGHNVMFDGRVLYDNGVQPYWNNDTMQMSFNLNPKSAKGKYSNKLKGITRRLFGHETPELSDILGKGNEDKYGYLSEKEVAMVYGCADADYTRLVYKKLRELMPDSLYNVYQKQDIPMLNQLYISEYNGLRIDEDKVKELADIVERDLSKIHEFLKEYVGRFINLSNKVYILESKYKRGEITEEDFNKEIDNIQIDTNIKYEFEMKSRDYRDIMFKKFRYPIISKTATGEIQTNKTVLDKLSSVKLDKPANVMTNDLLSETGDVLISAEKFNSLKYPIAYVLTEYKTLEKEFTAYYKPIRENNLEGRLFKDYSMTRIETFRIMNPSQTIKANLKSLVKPYSDDYYLVDFDMAQVEYRIMVSIAKQMNMVERLKDPEKDFHRESAAAILGIESYLVDNKTRKQFKAINFGIPYGLSDYRLSDKLYGSTKERDLVRTRILKDKFEQANENVIANLNHHRDESLRPVDLPIEFKRFCGYTKTEVASDLTTREVEIPVGMVKNALGRYRLFDLDELDNKKIGTIRRAAGNFPIQSFAAELFRIILINFANRCEREGISDKIKWNMLIHDELLFSAHKSLNPYYLYKLIEEECMVTFEGHTHYFVGINMGLSWAECKDDAAEAPVRFVRQQKEKWDNGMYHEDCWIDNPHEYLHDDMMNFYKNRIHEVILEIQEDIDTTPIKINTILNQMKNYTVRNYITDHFIPRGFIVNGKPAKEWKSFGNDETVDIKFIACLAEWAIQFYGEDAKFQDTDGYIIPAIKLVAKPKQNLTESFEIFFEDNLEDEFYNEETGEYEVGLTEYDLQLLHNEDYYDAEVKELKITDSEEKHLEYLEDAGKNLRIHIQRKDVNRVKSVLKDYVGNKGKQVVFVFKDYSKLFWLRVNSDVDLYKLDKAIREVI